MSKDLWWELKNPEQVLIFQAASYKTRFTYPYSIQDFQFQQCDNLY